MSSEIETELTFLAKSLPPEIVGVKPTIIEDIYIPEESEFPLLRLRRKSGSYEITKKIPVSQDNFSEHVEHTIELDQAEYEALKKTSVRGVSKKRYAVMIHGYPAEVDVFDAELQGLVLIDFEFKNKDEKNAFAPTDACLVDVTQEKNILGGQLAGKSYGDIADWLHSMGYKAVS